MVESKRMWVAVRVRFVNTRGTLRTEPGQGAGWGRHSINHGYYPISGIPSALLHLWSQMHLTADEMAAIRLPEPT